jgi:hypothetical protein
VIGISCCKPLGVIKTPHPSSFAWADLLSGCGSDDSSTRILALCGIRPITVEVHTLTDVIFDQSKAFGDSALLGQLIAQMKILDPFTCPMIPKVLLSRYSSTVIREIIDAHFDYYYPDDMD